MLPFLNQCISKNSNHFLFWKDYFSIQNELRNKYGKTGEFEILYGNIINVEAYAGYVDNRTNHWKQTKSLGGGCMYDMGVYPLNAARYITGEEPVAVTAQQSTTRPIPGEH